MEHVYFIWRVQMEHVCFIWRVQMEYACFIWRVQMEHACLVYLASTDETCLFYLTCTDGTCLFYLACTDGTLYPCWFSYFACTVMPQLLVFIFRVYSPCILTDCFTYLACTTMLTVRQEHSCHWKKTKQNMDDLRPEHAK